MLIKDSILTHIHDISVEIELIAMHSPTITWATLNADIHWLTRSRYMQTIETVKDLGLWNGQGIYAVQTMETLKQSGPFSNLSDWSHHNTGMTNQKVGKLFRGQDTRGLILTSIHICMNIHTYIHTCICTHMYINASINMHVYIDINKGVKTK